MSSSNGAAISDVAQQLFRFIRLRRSMKQLAPRNKLLFGGSSAMKAVNAKTLKAKAYPHPLLDVRVVLLQGQFEVSLGQRPQSDHLQGVLQHKTRQQHTATGRSVGRYGAVVS